MAFRVGQKVVCVDSSQWEHRLRLNAVYTISALGVPWDDDLYLGLEETPNLSTGNELHWRACRFRPVIERKTSIEVFEQIRRDVTSKTALPIREDEQV